MIHQFVYLMVLLVLAKLLGKAPHCGSSFMSIGFEGSLL